MGCRGWDVGFKGKGRVCDFWVFGNRALGILGLRVQEFRVSVFWDLLDLVGVGVYVELQGFGFSAVECFLWAWAVGHRSFTLGSFRDALS